MLEDQPIQIPHLHTKYVYFIGYSETITLMERKFKSFRNLRELIIMSRRISSGVFREICQLKNLTKLKIFDEDLDFRAVSDTIKCKPLEALTLSSFSGPRNHREPRKEIKLDVCRAHLENVRKNLDLRHLNISASVGIPTHPINLKRLHIYRSFLSRSFCRYVSRYCQFIEKVSIIQSEISESSLDLLLCDEFISKIFDLCIDLRCSSANRSPSRAKNLNLRVKKIAKGDSMFRYNFSVPETMVLTDDLMRILSNVRCLTLMFVNKPMEKSQFFSLTGPNIRVMAMKEFWNVFTEDDVDIFRKNNKNCQFVGGMKDWEEFSSQRRCVLLGLRK